MWCLPGLSRAAVMLLVAPPAADEADARRVRVLVPATAPELLPAVETAAATLASEGIAFETESLPPEEGAHAKARALLGAPGVAGVFWIRVETDAYEVWLLDDQGRTYARIVSIDESAPDAATEAIWHILESGSVAVVQGVTVAMEERAAPPEPEPQPQPEPQPEPEPEPDHEPPAADAGPPSSSQTWRAGVSAAYTGESVASALPWHSGVMLRGLFDPGPWTRLALESETFFAPRSSALDLRQRVAFRAGLQRDVGTRVGIDVTAGLGVEAQRWSTDETQGWRAVATAGGGTSVAVRITGPLWVWLSADASVPLNRFAYVQCERTATTCDGADRRVALDPWPVWPRVRAGVQLLLPR